MYVYIYIYIYIAHMFIISYITFHYSTLYYPRAMRD